jgi:hypothetical protein
MPVHLQLDFLGRERMLLLFEPIYLPGKLLQVELHQLKARPRRRRRASMESWTCTSDAIFLRVTIWRPSSDIGFFTFGSFDSFRSLSQMMVSEEGQLNFVEG